MNTPPRRVQFSSNVTIKEYLPQALHNEHRRLVAELKAKEDEDARRKAKEHRRLVAELKAKEDDYDRDDDYDSDDDYVGGLNEKERKLDWWKQAQLCWFRGIEYDPETSKVGLDELD